ncbi:MAG: Integrase core protein [Firmicutes bacterium]|nr:Integrase core protein [Bacillota bacterium]
MKKEVHYLMSQTQLNRFSVISKVIEGNITVALAAETLGLSTRQILRIKKGVIQDGVAALLHKNTNRKPAHTLNPILADQIIALKQSDTYQNANFQHFKELLEQHEKITISYSALHTLLTSTGIKSPKKRRRFKPHRRRKRKPQEGLLLQMDATPFEWFGSNCKYSLHGAIDDATSKVVGLYLTKNECLHGYWQTTRQCLLNYGIPAAIYADRHSIFLSQNAGKLTIEDQLAGKVVNDTQFGRAMSELGIHLIAARSAQAKGRVERLWETLQSRLPVEFKLANISTIEEANEFLLSYIDQFNQRFSVEAANLQSAYRPLPDTVDIDTILCIKLTRSVDNGGVFSFYNRQFKVLPKENAPLILPKAKILVLISPAFGVKVQFKQTIFDVLPYINGKSANKIKTTIKQREKVSPSDNHCWKFGQQLKPKLTYEDNDFAILAMLQNIFLSKYA